MGSDDKVFAHENLFLKFCQFCVDLVEKPVVWFRENIVVPNREEYYWYHEKIRRVPTVDECYTDDAVCIYEADEQYRLDKKVDKCIVDILKRRYEYCLMENIHDKSDCDSLQEAYTKGVNNFFIKYGDLGWKDSAIKCLIKQKNRMAFERRHGPVGSGRKIPTDVSEINSEKY